MYILNATKKEVTDSFGNFLEAIRRREWNINDKIVPTKEDDDQRTIVNADKLGITSVADLAEYMTVFFQNDGLFEKPVKLDEFVHLHRKVPGRTYITTVYVKGANGVRTATPVMKQAAARRQYLD